jgi:HKD family nuclease
MDKMNLLLAAEFQATFEQLFKECKQFWCAVAWGTVNPCLPLIEKNPEKVQQFIVGTDFYQTSPEFLERMSVSAKINCRAISPNNSGTFHPKLYLFIDKRGTATAIIGSANFTNAAMSSNTEAMLLIEGDQHDDKIKQLLSFVDICWKKAIDVDADFLHAYRIQWSARQSELEKMREFKRLKRPSSKATKTDPLLMTWKQFVAEVKADKEHATDKRLDVLRCARKLFNGPEAFMKLDEYERKALAGTLGSNEPHPDEIPWGWFGSMVGAGVFKKLIKNNSAALSNALDVIPLVGFVERAHYDLFVSKFRKAFDGELRGGGIPTASRLLAMKRPDYFVCFDSANKVGLSAHFGVAQNSVDLDSYWELIVEPMMLSPWWRTSRPAGKEGQIWDGRAALLDAIYYSPRKSA